MILPLILLFKYFLNVNSNISVIIFIISGYFVFLSASVTIVAAQKIVKEHKGVISGVMQGFSWGLGALTLAPLGYIGEKYSVDLILIIVSIFAFVTGIFAITKEVKKALLVDC